MDTQTLNLSVHTTSAIFQKSDIKSVSFKSRVGRFASGLAHPLVFGGDDEVLVLLGHHAAGAVGGLQHVDDQVVGQHVQLLHFIARHIHRARNTLPAWTN